MPEDTPINQLPTGAIGSKVAITFSTADLTGPKTRGIVNAQVEVETLHLIVFDENGMLVEVCEAQEHGSSDHDDHEGGRHYSVTLTVTDKPRIIHYVANCPVDQVVYGHETSIIGNMFVDRNNSEGAATEYEVAYWARIEVPHILVTEIEEEQADGTTKTVLSLTADIKDKFMHVPLLRNYAEITVTQAEDNNTFKILGFTVYNLLNRGTVAPYNSNTQQFQSFFEYNSEGGITKYLYPKMYKEERYEGHALTSAKLITDLVRNPDGSIKEFKLGEPFYVYERKVSVMTDEEEKWRESPPHIIIKARYNDGNTVIDTSPIYYYKMDLVYTEEGANGTEEIKYYNILRNFMYDYNVTAIHDRGYSSWQAAAAGAAGNNISGSSSTSKLTNVSDNEGRLWVSFTDITLVTNDAVTFRYKYIPNYYNTEGSEYVYNKVYNDLVKFENTDGGEVIKENGFVIATTDITSGEDAGWREVTISVNAPDDIIRQQIVSLKTNNANLNRQLRFTLRKKLTMQVECTPKVHKSILQPMTVDIKLPTGMTDDMFPLELNMETRDRTLSPDATQNSIPVTAGYSIIDGKRDELSYYYTVIIPTIDDYKALHSDGNMKVYTTHWHTNKADNASTFYVDNKYFTQGSDSWENYQYTFPAASCLSSALGVGQNVTISYQMANGATNKEVTIALKGMTYTGTLGGVTYNNADTVRYTSTSRDVTIAEGLKTTTDTESVSFTLDADDYNIYGPVYGARQTYQFDGAFGATSLETEADVEVDFTFNISADALAALQAKYSYAKDGDGVPMFVTLNRMHPADDQLTVSQARAEGDRYIYLIKQAGQQTIKLATIHAETGICTVTLEADYFDTQTVTIRQTDVKVVFNSWVKSTNNSVTNATRNYVYTNEKVRYYVNVSADNAPSSVTIDGISATRSGTFTGSGASNTTWYVDWSKSAADTYPMTATVVIDGQTYTQELGNMTVVKRNVTVGFNSWEDTYNSSVTDTTVRSGLPAGTVIVGENVRYYVNVSADEDPSSVTINNKSATKEATRSGESNTTWYIEYSNSTKGNQTISVKVSFTDDDNTYSKDLTLKVAGLTRSNNSTTSLDTSGNTLYVWRNNGKGYSSTYLTSVNTNLAANTSFNYYNLFTVDGSNIVSVARDQKLNGYNGNISFADDGTNYTISKSGNNIRVTYSTSSWGSTTTYYLRQTSPTAVQMSTTNSNQNWTVYSVTYDVPTE